MELMAVAFYLDRRHVKTNIVSVLWYKQCDYKAVETSVDTVHSESEQRRIYT